MAVWIETPDYRDRENEYSPEKTVLYFGSTSIREIIYVGRGSYRDAQPGIGPHIHQDCFELTYHCEGNQTYYIENTAYEIKPGTAFLALPGQPHSTGVHQQEISKFYYVTFLCDRKAPSFLGLEGEAARYLLDALLAPGGHIAGDVPSMEGLFREMMVLYHSGHPLREARMRSLLVEILCRFLEKRGDNSDRLPIPRDVEEIAALLDESPHLSFSMEELAQRAELSPVYFKKKFKRFLGLPPHLYALRAKTSYAKDMLRYTDLPVLSIALELGFSSSQHFSTVFRKLESCTPTEYRKRIRAKQP